MRDLEIKRIYDEPASADGHRVLVDRLWPRGITKERAHLDEWAKDVAPSTELRKWFSHDPKRMGEFRTRYLHELHAAHPPELKALAKGVGEGSRDPPLRSARSEDQPCDRAQGSDRSTEMRR